MFLDILHDMHVTKLPYMVYLDSYITTSIYSLPPSFSLIAILHSSTVPLLEIEIGEISL